MAIHCAASAAMVTSPTAPTLVVVGGGAAGFFGAIRAADYARQQSVDLNVLLLEAGPAVLSKVRISGGGRCNVCHDDTKELKTIASGYPRGEKALWGVFSRFGATDATAWFRNRGVELKTELAMDGASSRHFAMS